MRSVGTARGHGHDAHDVRRHVLDRPLVHVSTGYVFNGRHAGAATEDAPLGPLDVYGVAKAAGELVAALAHRHYVARIS